MIGKNIYAVVVFLLSCCFQLHAQNKLTTVGIQYKPIFPLSFVNTGEQSVIEKGVQFDLTLKTGFSGGMMIRHAFSDLLAFEAGINYTKRTYDLSITDGAFIGNSRFRIIGYEIPVSLLVYIQLGEKIFMNASLGHSLDMFASDVHSFDYYFQQRSFRNHVFQSSVIANLGWEYRTDKSGYFYLGASYHRPFSPIYVSRIQYQNNSFDETIAMDLSGNYLTVDIRYFFYEDPKKQKRPSTDQDE